jgi:hypothetical protein
MDWPSGILHDRQFALYGFTTEPGKVYYFRVRVFVSPRNDPVVDLDPVNQDEGEYLVAAAAHSMYHAKK